MDKKFQIFISSTFEDLRSARDQVIKAILEMGHIPVGMEMFSAGDEQQWEIIKRQIEQSDYYVVVVAHRYGSMVGEISYTEQEYDYAVALKIPVLGFVLSEESEWPEDHKENNKEIQRRLNNFRGKVGGKMVSFWKSNDDIYGKCGIALMKTFQTHPRVGWIRSDIANTSEMTKEITRLSRENFELRARIEADTSRAEIQRRTEADQIIDALRKNKASFSIFKKNAEDWTRTANKTLLEIFEAMAPDLIDEANEAILMRAVAFEVSNVVALRDNHPVPSNFFRDWIGDLVALGLIVPSAKRHSVNDLNRYWSLSQLGREVHGSIRRNALMRGLSTTSDDAEPDTEEDPFDVEDQPYDGSSQSRDENSNGEE